MYKHNNAIRAVSVLLCVGVVSLGAAFYYRAQAERMALSMQHQRQAAYSQLLTSLSSLETGLLKAKYSASSPMVNQLAAQIWRESAGATAALSTLPQDTQGLAPVQKFINQAGEYAFSLVRQNRGLTDADYETLTNLHSTADDLCGQLLNYQPTLGQNLNFPETKAAQVSSFGTEPQQAEYPALVYDGPFSDHLDRQEPALLQGMEPVTAQKAQQLAAQFAGVKAESLELSGETGGTLPCWRFTLGQKSLLITQQGGQPLGMTDGRSLGAPQLTPAQGADLAAQFLEQRGYANIKRSYYEEAQGAVTVNFAPVEQGRTLYPDLLKVSVALDTGDIIGFEARGYVMNHQPREYTAPTLPIEQAAQKLSPLLRPLSQGQAIIPTEGGGALDCYEFICQTPEGTHCLVYLDTQTGQERNILLLLESPTGVLTA